MSYDRGDVVLVAFPDSNLITAKKRPAVVVQPRNLNTGISQTVLAMISSNLARAGHPSRVVVRHATEGQHAGLRRDSVIMTDNIVTVLDVQIRGKLGALSDMSAVDTALRHTLGL